MTTLDLSTRGLLARRTLVAVLPAVAFAAFAATDANAASLTANFEPNKPLEIMNTDNDPNNKADISVVDGLAGFQGIGGDPNTNHPSPNPATDAPVSGLFGDGTVVDYRFFSSPADETISLELTTYAQGSAGRIGTVTATDAANVAGNQSFIQVWETSDPGTGFGGGSQVTPANPADFTSQTMAGLADGTGSIDISDMTDGQIYFLAGGFGGTERFTLTMTGPGQPDIEVIGDASWPRDNRVHLHDWSFDNADLLYDTINFHFFHADRDGSAARFGGVILDGTIAGNPALPGDTNGDGDVDDSDLGTSFANYTGPVGAAGGKTAADGDTNGDGDVDDSDLGTSFSNYTGPQSPAAVPEPTSLALLGLGGLLVARRRRA